MSLGIDYAYCHPSNVSSDNSTWHYSCDETYYDLNDFIYLALVLVSNIALVCLSKRERTKGLIRGCCWGHPGMIFPLNMLDGYENRLAYCAAFGSMTFELTSILSNPYGRFTSFGIGHAIKDDPLVASYPFIRILLLLVQVGVCTLFFYPFFFGLATRYKFVGAVIGSVLSCYKVCAWLWMSTCADIEIDIYSSGFKVKKHLLAMLLWPCIICMAVLMSQYIRIIITCIRSRQFGEQLETEVPLALPHHIEHVKHLLNGKKVTPWAEPDFHHVSIFNKEKFMANFKFRHVPGFKYPTRVMATLTVTVLAVYQMGTQVAFAVYSGLKIVKRYVRCADVLLPTQFVSQLKPYFDYIMKYADIAANLWLGTLVFSCILAILYVYHIVLCYRKHTLRVYRGERSMFPKNWIRENPHNILASASRHAGLQIAYTIWGFVIIQVFIYMIMCAIIFLLIIPVSDFGDWSIIVYLVQVVGVSLVLNQIIYWAQVIMNRFFLQDKITPTDDKPPLAMDNRKAWDNVSFFFFFWNLFLGVISALSRIIKGLILGVFFIPRIDRPVLMRGFELMDNGYYAYLSLLSVINAHDHPVVKVFVMCLMDRLKKIKDAAGDYRLDFEGFGKQAAVTPQAHAMRNTREGSKRAKYYWFLAYTLINNPDLLNYRKVEVETDVPDGDRSDAIRIKHKIVLAIHRKQMGEKTSHLYEFDA